MFRKAPGVRSPEEKWQRMQEGMKSGNVSQPSSVKATADRTENP
jgi:hypothetical protein